TDVYRDRNRLPPRHRPAGKPGCERAPVGIGHHEVGASIRQVSDVVDADDAIGINLAQQSGFLEETFAYVGRIQPVVVQNLDCHRRIEHLVLGFPHGGEPAGASLLDDTVPANPFRNRHAVIMPVLPKRFDTTCPTQNSTPSLAQRLEVTGQHSTSSCAVLSPRPWPSARVCFPAAKTPKRPARTRWYRSLPRSRRSRRTPSSPRGCMPSPATAHA